MKIRLGLVGPQDSLQNMMNVAKEYEDIEVITFPYERTEETLSILKNNNHVIDQWMFSGQAPYHYALNEGIITESQGSYPPLHGSSFIGTLLEAFVAEERIIHKFSVDTIDQSEFESAQAPYLFESLQFYFYSYKGYMEAQKLVTFHRDLYEAGKVEVALTCLKTVYSELKKIGIPCYRVKPANISIKLVLDFLRERGLSSKYRMSQLAVLGVETIDATKTTESRHFSYREKHQKLDLMKVLLEFSEDIKGSFVQLGDDLSFIYTTRGELDFSLKKKVIQSLIDKIKTKSGLNVKLGLGYGVTVLEAEQNLRLAFHHVREHADEVFVVVNEDREVIEYKANEELQFQQRNWGEEWEKRFKDASISFAIVSKIEALANHYKKVIVTSTDISLWLKCSERNSRRVLAEMERIGLSVTVGEEQSGHRGRPKKIYKLLFPSVLIS
ncbi:hypothetical protein [Aneurinibacillus sp. REN35]|uniref:hypothetical protein n=1 Tax=Aneurinibacillus sp. REN35 TaxID=3237286 RepID=UPI0035272C3E